MDDDPIVPSAKDNAIYMSGYLTAAEVCAHLAESCAAAWSALEMTGPEALQRFAEILRQTNDEHGLTAENRDNLTKFYKTIDGRFNLMMSANLERSQ